MARPSLTVVGVAHSEGAYAWVSLRSINQAVETARAAGIATRVVVVLNRADLETRTHIENGLARGLIDTIIEADFPDCGRARNLAVAQCTSDLIAIVDLDDLESPNWLTAAVTTWEQSDGRVIIHPEYRLFFGGYWAWQRFYNQNDPHTDLNQLLFLFPWSSTVVAPRLLWNTSPYAPNDPATGYGYEDWQWSSAAITLGYQNIVAPDTVRYYRWRADSICQIYDQTNAVIPPSPFFEDISFLTAPLRPDLRATSQRQRYLPKLFAAWRNALGLTVRPLRRLLPTSHQPEQDARAALPEPVRRWWGSAAELEPDLGLSAWLQPPIPFLPHPYRSVAPIKCYRQLAVEWPPDITHVFWLPWIMRSGMERILANYVQAVLEAGGKPLVILTETDQCEPDVLPTGVPVIRLAGWRQPVGEDDLQRLLVRLTVQRQPAHLVVINSSLAWKLVITYGRALSQFATIDTVGFTDDELPDGRRTSWLRTYLPSARSWLHSILTDSHRYRLDLQTSFDLSPDQTATVYTPQAIWREPTLSTGEPRRVLWAGRLDRQKRPERLIAIAKRSPKIQFDVWGATYLDRSTQVLSELAALPNVTLKGKYRSFSEIAATPYAAFIYTAAWDGLPLVLLEAAATGLPIVTTDAGGVGEFISERTGWLVEQTAGPAAFAAALQECLASPEQALAKARAAQELLLTRHSWPQFVASLRQTGLLDIPSSKQIPNSVA